MKLKILVKNEVELSTSFLYYKYLYILKNNNLFIT